MDTVEWENFAMLNLTLVGHNYQPETRVLEESYVHPPYRVGMAIRNVCKEINCVSNVHYLELRGQSLGIIWGI